MDAHIDAIVQRASLDTAERQPKPLSEVLSFICNFYTNK